MRKPSPRHISFSELVATLKQVQAENQTLRNQHTLLKSTHATALQQLREENARLTDALKRAQPNETDELVAARERAVRLTADIANLRRRQAEEVSRASRAAQATLLREFVESLDVLEQALASNPDPDSPWHQGTAGVQRQMMATLQRAGVARIGEAGDRFDPYVHEAVGVTPSDDVPAEHVVQVIRPGYRFANETGPDGLIRPARVIVSG